MKPTYSRHLLLSAAVISLIFTAGCAIGKTDFAFSVYPDKIVEQVKLNVRSAKVYRNLDTILIADILWYKPMLKRRHIIEMGAEGRITEDEKMKMLAERGRRNRISCGLLHGRKKMERF